MHKPSKSTTQQAVVGAGTAAMISGLIALGSNYYSQEKKNKTKKSVIRKIVLGVRQLLNVVAQM